MGWVKREEVNQSMKESKRERERATLSVFTENIDKDNEGNFDGRFIQRAHSIGRVGGWGRGIR